MFEYSGERKAKKIAEFAIVRLENSQPDNNSVSSFISDETQKKAGQLDIEQAPLLKELGNKPFRKTIKRRRNKRRQRKSKRMSKNHQKSR